MKLCTFEIANSRQVGIVRDGKLLPVSEVNARAGTKIPEDLLELIRAGAGDELKAASAGIEAQVPILDVRLCLPYAQPPKIWCIGLNYRSHAEDIDAVQPEEPGSFMKPTSALTQASISSELRVPPMFR